MFKRFYEAKFFIKIRKYLIEQIWSIIFDKWAFTFSKWKQDFDFKSAKNFRNNWKNVIMDKLVYIWFLV
jgi:hypothetical protein